jgi:hypothetical protein
VYISCTNKDRFSTGHTFLYVYHFGRERSLHGCKSSILFGKDAGNPLSATAQTSACPRMCLTVRRTSQQGCLQPPCRKPVHAAAGTGHDGSGNSTTSFQRRIGAPSLSGERNRGILTVTEEEKKSRKTAQKIRPLTMNL